MPSLRLGGCALCRVQVVGVLKHCVTGQLGDFARTILEQANYETNKAIIRSRTTCTEVHTMVEVMPSHHRTTLRPLHYESSLQEATSVKGGRHIKEYIQSLLFGAESGRVQRCPSVSGRLLRLSGQRGSAYCTVHSTLCSRRGPGPSTVLYCLNPPPTLTTSRGKEPTST